jgi:hypothetical protein
MARRKTRIAVCDYIVRIPDARVKMESPSIGKTRPYVFNGVIDARDRNDWKWDRVNIDFPALKGTKPKLTKETIRLLLIEGLQAAIYDELDNDEGEEYNPELDIEKYL